MLDLVKCEFWKIKRKGLFKIALFTAVLFPVFNIMLLSEGSLADVMSSVREESGFLLLIPILVIIAANLFFEEHDNDTLKNLLCVPISKSHLVIAKVTVLFLFSVAYELLGFCIGILIALAQGISLNGWALQLFLTFCTGILLWAAALPCIILVVWCNKSVFRWLYQFKVPEGKIMTDFYNRLSPYFVSTPVIFAILIAEAIVCIILVTRVLKKQEA